MKLVNKLVCHFCSDPATHGLTYKWRGSNIDLCDWHTQKYTKQMKDYEHLDYPAIERMHTIVLDNITDI